MYTYTTKGVCSRKINFDIEDNIIKNISFIGGCDGNLKAICSLAEGMEVETIIKKLKGISCDGKPTSCPDQLAKALEELLNE
ncbi:TIGR03905 family TSCPD domain-containing protein [Clostridium bovifaecis]|uniref:ribonucleoside-diphosphate reductase n=1 Tax=Clostridium bovifaecis TaxID=2184719 RepID=A0A6I6FAZ1_9CLOT|nr:TIGR03905 family TSCPD domain-containing protein [Clostridium bovifaecis]